MAGSWRVDWFVLAAALAVLVLDITVLAAGLASGGDGAATQAGAPGVTVAGSSSSVATPSGGAPGSGSTTTTTAAPSATAPAATATTAAPAVTSPPPTTEPGTPPLAMAAPGRYTVNVTGTAAFGAIPIPVPPQASFVVEQIGDVDQRHTSEGASGTTVQVARYTPDGILLVSLELQGALTKSFHPDPPVVYLPTPLTVGATWAWSTTSTDGQTTISHSSSVPRGETVTIAGQSVETFVVETSLTLSGDIQGTIRLTTWVSPAHSLPVRTHTVIDVTVLLGRATADTTGELVSLTPD